MNRQIYAGSAYNDNGVGDTTKFPKVYITPKAKRKMELYIQKCATEIMGFGEVEQKGSDFLIKDVFILNQDATSASTNFNDETLEEFLVGLIEAKKSPKDIKLWWHSHVNMGCFWSGDDKATARGFQNGWMISIVGNKRGEFLVRLDLFEPIRLTLDNLVFVEQKTYDPELAATIEAEVNEKVRVKTYKYSYPLVEEKDDDEIGFQPGKRAVRVVTTGRKNSFFRRGKK